ncbi:ABC transporter ATP-binding protein [Amycolatopsis sp. w19]|uniref:ABC transporter ATP-binding protein n=1 Tax=Amycolatopsis sp. w19 TaxID=3448134 RepID=UPI003F1CD1AA
MTPTAIDVDRLNLKYGDFHAVKDLSFQVRRGEFYALLGTNGAGKTSTLETLEGHRNPTSGTVRVLGKSPRDRAAVRPEMGVMLQESGFSPDLTVKESIRLIGALTRRTDRLERVLGIVDLTRKADTKVSQLSGGEKRRLDFATAVYGSPRLVFLDEPTTGLDIQSRDALWDAVDNLREDGSTIVLTTHYLEEAQQRADRIGLMHRGTFHREGTVAELTRTLPSVIRFSLPSSAPVLPVQGKREHDGKFVIETFGLQKDLHILLRWARDHAIELPDLEAGPTRLDDVFRAIEND